MTFPILKLQILRLCDQLTKEHMSNSTKEITITIGFHDYMFFGSPNETHCLNPMRYHEVFIENTYCHQPPSTVTQFVGIYDHIRVSLIGSKLLIDFSTCSISSEG